MEASGGADASANTRGAGVRRRIRDGLPPSTGHRRPGRAAFFELLGAVETNKLCTWVQANPAVQLEALIRLREYRATLDPDHQRLWKEWLDTTLASAASDKTGRKDFLT